MIVRHAFTLVALLAPAFLGGCARYVVLDPALVAARNEPDWTIRSQPAPAASTPPAAGAAAPAATVRPAPSDGNL